MENWKNWCRFCAKYDCEDMNAIYKKKSLVNKVEIVNKYFLLSISPFEESDFSICSECSIFLEKLEQFNEVCLRANEMFSKILQLEEEPHNDELIEIRLRYGFKEESSEQETQSGEIESLVKVEVLQNKAAIHEETSEVLTKRKRGRPKKSGDILKGLKIQIKQELASGEHEISETFKNTEKISDKEEETKGILSRNQQQKSKRKNKSLSTEDQQPRKIYVRSGRHLCEICMRSYSRKYLLTEHIREKHSEEKLPFACPKCDMCFVTEKKLKLHEVKHLSDYEKFIHPCPHCGKKFTRPGQIQTHIRVVHQGDKPFVCEECGKSFGTKCGLSEHKITHSGEYTIQCPHCPKKFKSNVRLKRHIDVHNENKFTCPHCGIHLKTQLTLKMHLLVHSDVKKYKCHHCGNEYKRSKALKNHLILHSGLRPYACPFCDKTFANGSNCRSHKKKAHPVELAAFEASGEVQQVTKVPKLEQLQPRQGNSENI